MQQPRAALEDLVTFEILARAAAERGTGAPNAQEWQEWQEVRAVKIQRLVEQEMEPPPLALFDHGCRRARGV